MRDFIQRMYHAIQEGNVELFDDIEEDIKRGNIELSLEHIYLKKLIISLVPIRVYTIAKKVKKYIKTMS